MYTVGDGEECADIEELPQVLHLHLLLYLHLHRLLLLHLHLDPGEFKTLFQGPGSKYQNLRFWPKLKTEPTKSGLCFFLLDTKNPKTHVLVF